METDLTRRDSERHVDRFRFYLDVTWVWLVQQHVLRSFPF